MSGDKGGEGLQIGSQLQDKGGRDLRKQASAVPAICEHKSRFVCVCTVGALPMNAVPLLVAACCPVKEERWAGGRKAGQRYFWVYTLI